MPGLFITFEGGDGSGKSTQSALLVEWLQALGHGVVVSREPGGTDVGLELRQLVLHWRGEIAPRAEALIYAADRAHNIATKVRPALERGEIVVQDRYLDSSVAYQGAGRVLEPRRCVTCRSGPRTACCPTSRCSSTCARAATGWPIAPSTIGSRPRETTSTRG